MVEQATLEILLQWLAGELRKEKKTKGKRRKRRRKNLCAIDVDSKVMVGDSVRSIIMARRRRCNLLGWRCKALVVFNGFLIVVVYSVVSEAEPGAGPEPWLTLSGNGGRGGAGGRVRDSCLYDFYGRCVYNFSWISVFKCSTYL